MDANRAEASREEEARALSLIETLDLPHPSEELLSCFVKHALHPVLAARYVNHRLSAGDARSMVSDWIYIVQSVSQDGRLPPPPDTGTQEAITRRDGNKCCITGKSGTRWDPLIVAPILPVPLGWTTGNPEISKMLGAFFGPPYRDWWLSYAASPDLMPAFSNHWLVRESAAGAFAQGLVKLDRQIPSMVEYKVHAVDMGPEEPIRIDGAYPLLGDHSRSGIPTVDARFVGSQARLCMSIQFVNIAHKIAPAIITHQPPGSSDPATASSLPARRHAAALPLPPPRHKCFSSLMRFPTLVFVSILRVLPRRVRAVAYNSLRKLSRRMYGSHDSGAAVQALPFGLFLKYQDNADMARNEFNALKMARQYTTIPAPEPLDMLMPADDSGTGTHLLMTRVPGVPLAHCQHVLSDADYDAIGAQLADYVAQLRAIPKTVRPEMAICNTLGNACQEHRIRSGDPVGPFADEAAFSQHMRFADEPSRRGHEIVFTHADLNPRNILVDRAVRRDGRSGCWRVTGIVDWETAGYYPEYWDYTKALFEGFRWSKRVRNMVARVFAEFGDYSRELDVETRAWQSADYL